MPSSNLTLKAVWFRLAETSASGDHNQAWSFIGIHKCCIFMNYRMIIWCYNWVLSMIDYPVADLMVGNRDTHPLLWPKSCSFLWQFWGKIGQNNRLAPPPRSWRPLLWEILDPPLIVASYSWLHAYKIGPDVTSVDSSTKKLFVQSSVSQIKRSNRVCEAERIYSQKSCEHVMLDSAPHNRFCIDTSHHEAIKFLSYKGIYCLGRNFTNEQRFPKLHL